MENSTVSFVDRLEQAMRLKQSVLCVGLDPQIHFIPPHLIERARKEYGNDRMEEIIAAAFLEFNIGITEAIMPFASVVKPQAAFYERSHHAWRTLEETIRYAEFKGFVTITDAKRMDGGDTADAYAGTHIGMVPGLDGEMVVAPMRSDAVTIGGYIAQDTINRFVRQMQWHGTGAFVVDKTSFRPNSFIENLQTKSGLTVWEELACCVASLGESVMGQNGYSNLGVVMGATYPQDADRMRELLPRAIKLVPGYGAQGGGADDAVRSFNEDGFGAVVNSSRGIIAAWQNERWNPGLDPHNFGQAAARAAQHARDELNAALLRRGIEI